VIPEEAIHPEWLDGKMVVGKDANEGVKERLTANVLLTIGDKQVTCHAAVTHLQSLEGKPILTIGMDSEEKLAMLCNKK